MLVWDAADDSACTAFRGSTKKLSSELQCLAMAGFDATTFGNHDVDHGPTAQSALIAAAHKAGQKTTVLASHTNLDSNDPDLNELKELVNTQVIKTHIVIARLTAREIKNILEFSSDRRTPQESTTREC